MRRGLAAIMAALCLAGLVTCLWWAQGAYMLFHGDSARDDAALDYLLGFAPDGGILDMNAEDYLVDRADAINNAAWACGFAALLARLGWLSVRRFWRRPGQGETAVVPYRIAAVLRGAATMPLALTGLLLGWMSFEFCAPWYWWLRPEGGLFERGTTTFVAELGAMSLLALLGAIWLLPRGSRWLVPLLVLATLVFRQAWGSGADQECLSLPGMLHGAQWVLQAD